MIHLKPINDRVVVKPSEPEAKTKSGLIIPEGAQEPPARGEVIAVGPGKDGNMMTVRQHDIVLYGRYAGQEVEIDGTKLLILREDDIFLVIE